MQEERLYTVGCFTKTSFLDIHIAQSLFLVLRSIETDVRKCIFPKYLGGGPVQGKEAYLGRMHFLTTISVGPNFYNLIFVNRSTVQLGENQLIKDVSRMARMAGVSPEDPEERMKDEKMPRRGSTAL